MLQPGSKGWINKYFNLLDKGLINIELDLPKGIHDEQYIHLLLSQTGLNFGFASEMLFTKSLETKKWTYEESLKLLLFEAHLLVYKTVKKSHQIRKEDFIRSLLLFYGKHNSYSITKIFTFFLKEENDERLENILSKRVDVKVKLLDHRKWINTLSNVFVYIDVILFYEFLKNKNKNIFYNYTDLSYNALLAIILSSYSDGEVQDAEKSMFKIFLASANLPDEEIQSIEFKFKHGARFSDFNENIESSTLFKQFILDISILTIYIKNELYEKEVTYLKDLCKFLAFSEQNLKESILLVEKFVLQNNNKVSFLQNTSSYEKMFSNLTKQWLKILGRNKDKLATELKQSKDLIYLIKKSATEELTKEEKEVVKTQFLDIVKSMPSLAIFMLPGGALLLPLVLKIIPDLVPSAFRDNEIDKKD